MRNRYSEAFREQYNLVGLASTVAIAAACLTPLPLLAGLVAEAAYLLFVPDSRWYTARLGKRNDAEIEQRREALKAEVFPTLRPEIRQQFLRLEEMRRQIGAQSADANDCFHEVPRKLDYLLEQYLRFASKEAQFRTYLGSLRDEIFESGKAIGKRNRDNSIVIEFTNGRPSPQPPTTPSLAADPNDRWVQLTMSDVQAAYDRELREIDALARQEQDAGTKAVLEKRSDVVKRREEYLGKMGKVLVNLNHQMQLLVDTFGLINDEIRARTPEQILEDINDVVVQTDSMTRTLEELAPFEQLVSRMKAAE